MSIEKKESFLRDKFIALLRQVPTERQPLWGKMTLQQMIEHFADSVRVASGKTVRSEILTPEEKLPAFQDFLLSDKPYKENTVNPLMPEIPAPVRNKSVEKALVELETEVKHFFEVFEANEHLITRNPFFGDLNYQMNVQALYKHALHHLKQFGVDLVTGPDQQALAG